MWKDGCDGDLREGITLGMLAILSWCKDRIRTHCEGRNIDLQNITNSSLSMIIRRMDIKLGHVSRVHDQLIPVVFEILVL